MFYREMIWLSGSFVHFGAFIKDFLIHDLFISIPLTKSHSTLASFMHCRTFCTSQSTIKVSSLHMYDSLINAIFINHTAALLRDTFTKHYGNDHFYSILSLKTIDVSRNVRTVQICHNVACWLIRAYVPMLFCRFIKVKPQRHLSGYFCDIIEMVYQYKKQE